MRLLLVLCLFSLLQATDLPLTWSKKENLVRRTELPGHASSSPIMSRDKVSLICYSGNGIDIKTPGT